MFHELKWLLHPLDVNCGFVLTWFLTLLSKHIKKLQKRGRKISLKNIDTKGVVMFFPCEPNSSIYTELSIKILVC